MSEPLATAGPMRGPSNLRRVITDYLSKAVPDLLPICREKWNLAEWQLPNPVAYDAYDPYTLNDYPVVGCFFNKVESFSRVAVNARGEEEFKSEHTVTVFGFVMTPTDPNGDWEDPTKEATMRTRDDIVYTIANTILLDRSFNSDCIKMISKPEINWFEPTRNNDQSPVWVAGGTIGFRVQYIEPLYRQPIGRADTITQTIELLPQENTP